MIKEESDLIRTFLVNKQIESLDISRPDDAKRKESILSTLVGKEDKTGKSMKEHSEFNHFGTSVDNDSIYFRDAQWDCDQVSKVTYVIIWM